MTLKLLSNEQFKIQTTAAATSSHTNYSDSISHNNSNHNDNSSNNNSSSNNQIISNQLKGVISCKWLVICTSCLFIIIMSWEIVGDKEGWEGAIWVPFTGLGIILLLGLINYFILKLKIFKDGKIQLLLIKLS